MTTYCPEQRIWYSSEDDKCPICNVIHTEDPQHE